jgi:pilus assembly protein CpaF
MTENEILTALGPLAPLMQDPAITEILVDSPTSIYFERKGQLENADVTFASPDAIRAVIDAVLALDGLALGPGKTTAEVRLPDGSRFLAIIPPTAADGPCITIRKFFKNPLSMEKLYEWGAITPAEHAALQSAIRARLNLLVAGDTGSGKTTFLNILTGDIPAEERVVTVEETLELQPRSARVVRLATENTSGLTFTQLIDVASHTRPDRLIFGEMRGPEVLRMIQVMSMGYDGSMSSIHATSSEDALARMESFCLMANLGLGLSEIRALIASTVGLVAFMQRRPDGARKVMQITEVRGLDNDRYMLQPLFRFNVESGQHESTGVKPGWEG